MPVGVNSDLTTSCNLRFQMLFQELEIDIPIGRDRSVSASVHIISEGVANQLARVRRLVVVRSALAEQFVDGPSCDRCKKFTLWVRPAIGIAGLEQQWARSH